MRIFGKHLLLHLSTLIISFVFLGLVLTQGIRGFLTERRADELMSLAQRVAHSMENFTEFGARNVIYFRDEILNIHRYTDAAVLLIDTEYNPILSIGLPYGAVAEIYVAELRPLMDGYTVVVLGTANHPALEPLLVAGYPFWIDGEIAGAALVGFSMAELEAAISEMYRITMIALLITAAFAFLLIYASSRAISRPLRQINDAAGIIASGEFDKRIPIKGKDEVGQLATQFNKMAESLQDQERVRHAFIANLSHDIRSPLTSMRGFLMAINDGIVPPEEQPYYLGIILDETERLIKLSNDIMDIHRIHDTEIVLERSVFDINGLIRKTILGFSRRATDKRLMITSRFAHPEDMVEADEDKIRRSLYNLIDNAVKFTGENGEITVETTISKEKVAISVHDNGRGMTEEEKKYIFDRFYKGDPSRGEDKMGNGLGLSIVKAFVRAHGETLTVDSSPDKGSVFTFTLALASH
ncbi:MAG: HAMP domain-containing histidine kinase [Defluviitaleaceae bacterium]|nr:HAMP domain-containing histidine kinase [Defluviitaleaceae bacterium]